MTKHVLPPYPKAVSDESDPIWWRALRHSNDVGLAVLPFLLSALVFVMPLFPGFEPSRSLNSIPIVLSLALASVIGTGGAVACLGLLWSGRVVSTGWTLERAGWILIGGGWCGYAATVFYYFPESTLSWAIPGFLGILALIRIFVVWLIERLIRPRAEAVKRARTILEEDGR